MRTSPSRTTSTLGCAARPDTTRPSKPAARSWLATLPPELLSAQPLVIGDLPTIWMRPENGVFTPVRRPETMAKHASGASASAPAGKCFHISQAPRP